MKTRWMVAVAMAAALSGSYAQAAGRQGDNVAPPAPAATAESVSGAPSCWAGGCQTAAGPAACDPCGSYNSCGSQNSSGTCDTSLFKECGKSNWIMDAEVAFLRYHRSAGVDTGLASRTVYTTSTSPQDIEFDYNATPRITVGWAAATGLGVRLRWWDYDHTARATNSTDDYISVDAFTMDLEVFDEIRLTKHVRLEGSGGIRLVNFREDVFASTVVNGGGTAVNQLTGRDYSSRFGAYGGVVGLQMNYDSKVGTFFARARYSIMMGDSAFQEDAVVTGVVTPARRIDIYDTVQSIAEVSIGYEIAWEMKCGATFSVRGGAEWQQWMNFDYNSSYISGPGLSFVPADVGFGGVFAGCGLKF